MDSVPVGSETAHHERHEHPSVYRAFAGDSETDNWPGKKIVVYDDDSVEFGGKVVGGVRSAPCPRRPSPRPSPSPQS